MSRKSDQRSGSQVVPCGLKDRDIIRLKVASHNFADTHNKTASENSERVQKICCRTCIYFTSREYLKHRQKGALTITLT